MEEIILSGVCFEICFHFGHRGAFPIYRHPNIFDTGNRVPCNCREAGNPLESPARLGCGIDCAGSRV
jgi:hypothetical protein